MQQHEPFREHTVNTRRPGASAQQKLSPPLNTIPTTEQRTVETNTRLNRAIERVRHVQKRGAQTSGMLFLIGLVCACVLLTLFVPDPNLRAKMVLGSIPLFAVLLVPLAQYQAQLYANAVQQLVQLQHPGAVGPLLEIMENAVPASRFQTSNPAAIAARKGLLDLLPRLQPQDAALLTPHHRAILLRKLQTRDEVLILATLTALERVGDSSGIPEVQSLALGHLKAGEYPEVREAALRCWGKLQEHAYKAEVRASLLRASRPTDEPASETLLRPASSSVMNEHPQELLRASIENSNKTTD